MNSAETFVTRREHPNAKDGGSAEDAGAFFCHVGYILRVGTRRVYQYHVKMLSLKVWRQHP